jgi:hypothetical protein
MGILNFTVCKLIQIIDAFHFAEAGEINDPNNLYLIVISAENKF